MRIAFRFVALLVALVLVPALAAAQPPGGRGRGGPGGPGGFFGNGVVGLVQQEEVRKEIELSQEQETQLREMGEQVRGEIQSQMGDMFRGMRDLTDEERQAKFEEIRTKFDEINKDVEGRLQKVLLPHQFDRLKQINVQARLQREGAGALTSGELAQALDLTDSQREQLEEKQQQVQKDLNDKIAQLRLDARNQLMEVLTPEQRAKLEGLMGAQFNVPEPQFGPPRGRGGFMGRGGRGGRDRGGDQGTPPASE